MTETLAMGRTIREARLAKGMSLGQLAAAVGRSSASVRRWERGEVAPAIGIIDDLAAVLDLDADDLRSQRSPAAEPAMDAEPVSGAHPDTGRVAPQGPTTIEQDLASATSPAPKDPSPERSTPATRGVVGDALAAIRNASTSWSGWIRAALTVVLLIVMALILIWAMGQLAAAIGDIWDSFDTGSTN